MWYLARIDTPKDLIVGATIPGLPLFVLGHNQSIAWGVTSSQTDTQDLFVETVDPANPNQYLTPDGPKAFDSRDEKIHVKGASRRRAAHSRDAPRTGHVGRQQRVCFRRRRRSGRRARVHRSGRQGHDHRGADERQRGAQLGRIRRARCVWPSRRCRTSATPTSTATSASLRRGSSRCASPATAWRRERRDGRRRLDRLPPIRAAAADPQSSSRLRVQRQQCARCPGSGGQGSAPTGTSRSAPAACSSSSIRSTNTRWKLRR